MDISRIRQAQRNTKGITQRTQREKRYEAWGVKKAHETRRTTQGKKVWGERHEGKAQCAVHRAQAKKIGEVEVESKVETKSEW